MVDEDMAAAPEPYFLKKERLRRAERDAKLIFAAAVQLRASNRQPSPENTIVEASEMLAMARKGTGAELP